MQLCIGSHLWENLLFNRSRTERDSFENIGVEDIYSSVDSIRNEFDGFFDETFDLSGLRFHDCDAVFGWFFDFRDDDGPFFAMSGMEFRELSEWIVLELSVCVEFGDLHR